MTVGTRMRVAGLLVALFVAGCGRSGQDELVVGEYG